MLRPPRAAAWPALLAVLIVASCDQEPETLKGPVAVYQGPPPPKHGFLGVQFVPGENVAAVVDAVVPGGPAQQAGLSAGDIVVSIDGRTVASPQDVVRELSDNAPGTTVVVGISRDGQQTTAPVRLITFMEALALEQQAARNLPAPAAPPPARTGTP